MALGPYHQIAIACGTSGTNSLVISEDFFGDTTPHVHKLLGETGTDETWYNPGDNHYFFPQNTPAAAPASPTLGVVDTFGDDPFSFVPQVDTPNPGGVGNKVAADPVANYVYVPVTPTSATTSNVCQRQ